MILLLTRVPRAGATYADWEGDLFCPCCEVISLELPPPYDIHHASIPCCCDCLRLSGLPSSLIGRSLACRPTCVAVAKNGWGDDEDDDSLAALYCDFSWANSGTLFDLILSPLVTDLYNDLSIEVRAVLVCVPDAFSGAVARVLLSDQRT